MCKLILLTIHYIYPMLIFFSGYIWILVSQVIHAHPSPPDPIYRVFLSNGHIQNGPFPKVPKIRIDLFLQAFWKWPGLDVYNNDKNEIYLYILMYFHWHSHINNLNINIWPKRTKHTIYLIELYIRRFTLVFRCKITQLNAFFMMHSVLKMN